MSMIACRNGFIIITPFLKMGAMSQVGGGIWYMHKLIIASSTTLQISATLNKLHPTDHMLHVHVHIFDVGETNASIVISN